MCWLGATIVGSMATVWHGVVNPPRPGAVRSWTRRRPDHHLQPRRRNGRFLLGSTVVMLWPRNTIQFNPQWATWPTAIRLGEAMGNPV